MSFPAISILHLGFQKTFTRWHLGFNLVAVFSCEATICLHFPIDDKDGGFHLLQWHVALRTFHDNLFYSSHPHPHELHLFLSKIDNTVYKYNCTSTACKCLPVQVFKSKTQTQRGKGFFSLSPPMRVLRSLAEQAIKE